MTLEAVEKSRAGPLGSRIGYGRTAPFDGYVS